MHRALGFRIGEVRSVLGLWQDRDRPAAEVARLAERHAEELQTRISVLQTMALALRRLTEGCATGDRPHCPVLDQPGCGFDEAAGIR